VQFIFFRETGFQTL